MGKKNIRQNKLIETIKEQGYLKIRDASELFDVSDMTIRRDIDYLENKGLLRNVNGVLLSEFQDFSKNYKLEQEINIETEKKNKIGKFAASMIKNDNFIIFDGGTTTEKIIKYIDNKTRFKAACFTRNIFENLLKSEADVEVSLAGGVYYADSQMFISREGNEYMKNLRANIVFASAAGIHEHLGITSTNTYDTQIKKTILNSAEQKVLVSDSSKFNHVHPGYICDLNYFDCIITDKDIPQNWIEIINNEGIELYIV